VSDMNEVKIEKVVVNCGAGESGDKLQKAKKMIEMVTGRKASLTKARKREQTFKIKKGEPIGVKVTLRKKEAEEFLKKAFAAVDNKIKKSSFDKFGNLSFGIKEYIYLPGTKYDPSIGLLGFDVCISFSKPGFRVKYRRRKRSKIPLKHYPTKEECINFLKEKFGVTIEE
jgi:large subunit ribosomal protein L5